MYWHPDECRFCEERDDEGSLRGVALDAEGTCPRCERVFLAAAACYRCGEDCEPRTLDEMLDEAARPVPELGAIESWIFSTWSLLGRDGDGRPTMVEQLAALDELGLRQPSPRRLVIELWNVITTAASSERKRKMDQIRAERKK